MSLNRPRQSAVPSTSIRRPRALLAGMAALLLSAAMMAPAPAHASGVSVINAFAGAGVGLFGGDGGPAGSAQMSHPTSVAADAAGNLYIADYNNNRVRMVPALSGTYFGRAMSAGDIYTLAGTNTVGYGGDGGLASAAELNSPAAVAVDSRGNVYITDETNQRVRMIVEHSGTYFGGLSLSAGKIYTVAGNGTGGYTGDGGAADSAELGNPDNIAVDASGNLYITEYLNNSVREVAAVNGTQYGHSMSAGDIYTIAGGTYGFGGDGGLASAAKLDSPDGVAVDINKDVYISDWGNQRVRELAGVSGTQFTQSMLANHIYTIAGDGTPGYDGDGWPATTTELNYPSGVAVDRAHNLYIADAGNNRVREVAAGGNLITTVAGNGAEGPSGNGGAATGAELYYPTGVAFDPAGAMYIADYGNNVVRRVAYVAAPTVTITSSPPASSTATSGSVTYTLAGGAASATACTLDGASTPCASGTASFQGLSVGAHTFIVNVSGQGGTASASAAFAVTAPPVTPTPPQNPAPLSWSHVRLSARTVTHCAAHAHRCKVKSVKLSFVLNHPAKLTLTLQRKVGKRMRTVHVTVSERAGAHSYTLKYRFAGHALAAGNYRLSASCAVGGERTATFHANIRVR